MSSWNTSAALLCTLSALTLVSLPSSAQLGPDAEGPRAAFDRMAAELELSRRQKLTVAPIMRGFGESLRDLSRRRASGEIRGQEALREFRHLQDSVTREMAEVLDSDQLARYREMQRQARRKLRESTRGGQR